MNKLLARWIEAAGGEWGRGEVPLPFPAAQGKPGKKNFRSSPRTEKPYAVIDLGHDSGKNRRRGREPAGKHENPRIAAWLLLLIANTPIHN
jgi:hypothetical protein